MVAGLELIQWTARSNGKERGDCDRHGRDSKPSLAILLCPLKRRFTALSPAWRSEHAILHFSHISKKLKNKTK